MCGQETRRSYSFLPCLARTGFCGDAVVEAVDREPERCSGRWLSRSEGGRRFQAQPLEADSSAPAFRSAGFARLVRSKKKREPIPRAPESLLQTSVYQIKIIVQGASRISSGIGEETGVKGGGLSSECRSVGCSLTPHEEMFLQKRPALTQQLDYHVSSLHWINHYLPCLFE